MRWISTSRMSRFALVLSGIVALGAAAADAKPGSSGSAGSRGSKTYSAPPSTSTAPRTAQPMQRTQQAAAPNAGAAATGSRFGSGFGGMLMGGLLGAGLFGLLSGSGLFSGMAGAAGFLGLMLQVALIGGVIYLAMRFFRSRSAQPAMAGGPAGMMNRETIQQPQRASTPAGGFGGGGVPATSPLVLEPTDYEAFERLLVGVQDAYGKEDPVTLRNLVTPEMHDYFGEEIEANRRKNVHNLTSDAKLLQGDLSEAWSELGAEYASVAMRYSLLETTVERGTGRIVSGNADVPSESVEIWTFVRRPASGPQGWQLSAIQQAS